MPTRFASRSSRYRIGGALTDGGWRQRARLASGLVLFVYVATHFLNHAAGLISLAAMETGRHWFLFVWRGIPGTVLLYGALALHMALGLYKLARRRDWRMQPWEAAQIVLGLAIPPLLALHVIGTRGQHEMFGLADRYVYVLAALWPDGALRQTALMAIVWLHGCIGINYWLRLQHWYRSALPLLAVLATLLPVLSFLGFAAGGREVAPILAEPASLEAMLSDVRYPGDAGLAWGETAERRFVLAFSTLLGGIVLWRLGRAVMERRDRRIRITYPDGRRVAVASGTTVLEASRLAGVPHASMCGGRGRCSTCRVRVGRGLENLPPPGEAEARVLSRIGMPEGVRLACQLRPTGNISITPLLPPSGDLRRAIRSTEDDPRYRGGAERELVVLFADLRAFTALSEQRLPFDTVFLLNQYFRVMGEAIEGAGGRVDKFIGDGIMALFGLDTDPATAARQGLAAARAMMARLDALNVAFAQDLPMPLRMGIGVHGGAVIVGEMGYKQATSVTAIGDVVNVASRLETMTKELGCPIVISDDVVKRAGIDLAGARTQEVAVRGRRRPLTVYALPDAERLPATGGRVHVRA